MKNLPWNYGRHTPTFLLEILPYYRLIAACFETFPRDPGAEATMTSVTLQLAGQVASLSPDDIPSQVLSHARLCILDTLGAALRGSREPGSGVVQALFAVEGGAPIASVWGQPLRIGALDAALLNGVSAHALDYDDTHQGVPVHVTATVLPAVFAASELTGKTMRDLLTGYAAGAEIAIRAGLALGRSHVQRGWHPTGTVGTLGAAAGSAHVLGLPPTQIAQVLGLAATQAAGFMKAVTGNMAKPLNAGKASMNGLLSSLLVRGGYSGPDDIFAPGSDFATAFSEGFDPAFLAFAGSAGWEISNIAIKLSACCSLAQAALEGGRAIRRTHHIQYHSIAEVELQANPRQVQVAGIPRPRTGLEAKFSLTYCTALGLCNAAGDSSDFEDGRWQSPGLAALMEKVRIREDPALSEVSARVRVKTTGGQTLEQFVAIARGNPGNPATADEVKTKFRSLAGPTLGERRDELIDLILEDESMRLPVKDLAVILAGSSR